MDTIRHEFENRIGRRPLRNPPPPLRLIPAWLTAADAEVFAAAPFTLETIFTVSRIGTVGLVAVQDGVHVPLLDVTRLLMVAVFGGSGLSTVSVKVFVIVPLAGIDTLCWHTVGGAAPLAQLHPSAVPV